MDEKKWSDAKTDYVTSTMSYRQIAEKYHITYSSVEKRARAEKWREQRRKYCEKLERKKENIAAGREASKYKRIIDLTSKALDRIEVMLDRCADEQGMRALIASIRDIKTIQGVRTDAEAREQDARIANLERQANADQSDEAKQITVRIEGGGGWSN